jgi:hypothetical protein
MGEVVFEQTLRFPNPGFPPPGFQPPGFQTPGFHTVVTPNPNSEIAALGALRAGSADETFTLPNFIPHPTLMALPRRGGIQWPTTVTMSAASPKETFWVEAFPDPDEANPNAKPKKYAIISKEPMTSWMKARNHVDILYLWKGLCFSNPDVEFHKQTCMERTMRWVDLFPEKLGYVVQVVKTPQHLSGQSQQSLMEIITHDLQMWDDTNMPNGRKKLPFTKKSTPTDLPKVSPAAPDPTSVEI